MMAPVAAVQSAVPAWVARTLDAELSAPDTGRAERFAAAVMVVDVSGFTALGERLAARGAEGAEILWRVVNAFFDKTLHTIHAHGGDVLRFAGDAPLVVWRCPPETPFTDVALRAAACGLALQSSLAEYDTGEGAIVRFRVGIGCGNVVAAQLGGVGGRWEPIVGGAPVSEAGAAGAEAQVGQVVVSAQTWKAIGASSQGELLASGRVRLTRLTHAPSPSAATFPVLTGRALDALRRFVPRAVLDRLESGHGRWLGELRTVTTVFATIDGLDYHSEDIALRLQTAFRALQSVVYQYQGEINQFLVDDKGTVLLAAWGMPGSTHEGDPTRAVRASLELQRALHKLGLNGSVGVSTGRIFCGVKGNSDRSEYGLLGAKVNLAARLSGQAQGEILCDVDTQQGSQSSIVYAAPLGLSIKGHSAVVQAFRVRNAREEEVRPVHGAMVGRESERAVVREHLDAFLAGKGSLLLIEGEAGIGKSTLIAYLQQEASRRGVRVLMGAAERIQNQTPYCAFKPIFADVVGLAPTLEPAERVYAALDWFERHGELKSLAPLFNSVLQLALPDNQTTRPMEGEARANTAREAFLQVLSSHAPVIVIDDLQWLDSASWTLAQMVIRQVPHALCVFTSRPTSDGTSATQEELAKLEGLERLSLKPLERKELEALACAHLQVNSLAPTVAEALWQRAGGYPFYAQELASALLETGAIQIVGGLAAPARGKDDLSQVSLPNSLAGVIATRLDRLSPTAQLSLKTASVIGRSFGLAMVRDIYPVPEDRDQVKPALDATRQQELTVVETPEPRLAYTFKHIITQEVTYENLLVQQRQALHRAAADWYESGVGGSVELYYPLIAHHCQRANERERAIRAFELAGEQALASFANREALSFMRTACELDARGTPSPALRRARWRRVMGLASSRLGMTSESLQHLGDATKLMGFATPRIGIVLVFGLVSQIIGQVWRRFVGPRRVRDDRRALVLDTVNTFAEIGLMAWYHNNVPLLLYTSFRAMNLADDAGKSPELARMRAAMSVILSGVPMHRAAETYAQEAITIAEQFGHELSTARAHQYYGCYLVGMGRWNEVQTHADAALSSSTKVGDDRGVDEAINLEIYVHLARAQYTQAEEKAKRQFDSAGRRGDAQVVLWSEVHCAEIAWRRGQFTEARALLDQIDPHKGSDPSTESRYWGLQTLLLLDLGEFEQALELVRKRLLPQKRPATLLDLTASMAVAALAIARLERDRSSKRVRRAAKKACRHLRGFAAIYPFGLSAACHADGRRLCLEGKVGAGISLLRQALSIAVDRDEPYDQMLAHRALGALTDVEDRDQHNARALALSQSFAQSFSVHANGDDA